MQMTHGQFLDKLIKKHKLDRIQDWATIRILWEILTNSQFNRDINIGKPNTYMKGDPEPMDIAIPKIRELFKTRHEIIFSQSSGQGDEGDPAYLCFLIKPEYKESFRKAWDKHPSISGVPNNTDPGLFFSMNYLLKHPNQFVQIWAGPY